MDLGESDEGIFYDSVLKGNAHKEIVRLMLEKSGYSVHPYGYESTLSSVKSKLTKNTRNSDGSKNSVFARLAHI